MIKNINNVGVLSVVLQLLYNFVRLLRQMLLTFNYQIYYFMRLQNGLLPH